MSEKTYCVYIMTNQYNKVLYTGVTGDLEKRVLIHKSKTVKGFTKRYNVDKLVYYEFGFDPLSAIEREKQIKAGSRQKKIELIESINSDWNDLYEKL